VERRSGLGRGLGALIPPASGEAHALYREVPVASVSANQFQPRSRFDEEALSALVASVRELGVLQPILVREVAEDAYELIAGERRWRAARRAGLTTIPAIVRAVDDTRSLEQALVENVQREDLNPIDEATAYRQLIEDFELTHDEVATRVGRSRATISNALRLFQLPPGVQRLVLEGRLTAGHARALLMTPDRAYQEVLAARAVEEAMSVRSVETAARRHKAQGSTGPSGRRAASGRSAPLLELENLLAHRLDTRVRIAMATRARPGRLTIEFADLADLERIYRAMAGSPVDPQADGPSGAPRPQDGIPAASGADATGGSTPGEPGAGS